MINEMNQNQTIERMSLEAENKSLNRYSEDHTEEIDNLQVCYV